MKALRLLVLVTVLALVAVSCGGDEAGTPTQMPTTTGATTTSSQSPAVTSDVTTTSQATATTATQAPATTTAPPTATTTMAGEPFDIHPVAGEVLGVVGVAHDDVLNVRELPGLTTIVTTLGPLDDDVVSAGQGRLLPTSIWWKVDANATVGWVNAGYVAYLGAVDDLTSFVVSEFGSLPAATTMADLGMIVAKTLASEDPQSEIVMTVEPSVGDLGEVTYDVIGLGDDAQVGWRLHVFGTPAGDGFGLKSVEATALCGRGLSDGLCV